MDAFVASTQRFMQRYQPNGAGTINLFQKTSGSSRFDYLTISRWGTEDFFKSFKNGVMPMGSARIEQAGGYFCVDQKGEEADPRSGESRVYLGFRGELTEEMMKPLMEKASKWRIFKSVARKSFYSFIWEGVIDEGAPELENLKELDRGVYHFNKTFPPETA